MDSIDQISERKSPEKSAHVECTDVGQSSSSEHNADPERGAGAKKSVSKREQAWELFKPMFGHFIFNCILWGIFYYIILYTKQKGVLTRKQKHIYNVFIIGLPLIIGIHTAHSFKRFPSAVRWKLLDTCKDGFKLSEVNWIMDLGSYTTVTRLAINWAYPYSVSAITQSRLKAVFCLTWVILMLASQVALALLGLVVEMKSRNALLTQPGFVNATKLDDMYDPDSNVLKNLTIDQQQILAYGHASTTHKIYNNAKHTLVKESVYKGHSHGKPGYGQVDIERDRRPGYWYYEFRDWTIRDGLYDIPSDRTVSIDTDCAMYSLTNGSIYGIPPERSWWGDLYKYSNNGSHINHPVIQDGFVTILNPDYKPNEQSPNGTQDQLDKLCGNDRCATLGIFVVGGKEMAEPHVTEGKGNFFECNITVSNLPKELRTRGEFNIPNTLARVLAGALGADGDPSPDNNPSGGRPRGSFIPQFQWQSFRYNSYLGNEIWIATNRSQVADVVGGYTAGGIANLDRSNPRILTRGTQVVVGVELVIQPRFVILIMCLFLGFHFTLIVSTIWYCCDATQRDNTYLSNAFYLKDLILNAKLQTYAKVTGFDYFDSGADNIKWKYNAKTKGLDEYDKKSNGFVDPKKKASIVEEGNRLL
ncbi:hypothetical protein DFH27DRAFT_584087 [Peziza echinospora]|nr:hypothetical protein DFH27DRAFT_584087 [Peziza echinospora]